MNGTEQVKALAKLAGYMPENLGGIRIGDTVRLPSIAEPLQVVQLADPLVTLRTPNGKELKAGWRAVQKTNLKGTNR